MSSRDAASNPQQPCEHHRAHNLKRKIEEYAEQEQPFPLLKMVKPSSPASCSPPFATPAAFVADGSDQSVFSSSSVPPASLPSSSASSSAPSPPPSEEVHFFVRLLSQGSRLFRARPTDTVNSIIEQIESFTGIPCSEQRLIYCGRQLQGDSTLLQCDIQRDASVYLTARLRSTTQLRAWRDVNDLIAFICSASENDVPLAFLNLDSSNVERLVKQFLTSTLVESNGDKDKIFAHLRVFSLSGAPSAIVKLYLSSVAENRNIAEAAIKMLLRSDTDFLPEYMHLQCAPILLTFCKIFISTVGRNDRLYVMCRSALARLLKGSTGPLNIVHMKSTQFLLELHSFIIELVGLVDLALGSYAMLVSNVDIADLYNFLAVMRHAVQDWKGTDGTVPKCMFDRGNPRYESGIGMLHELFLKLVNKVGQCLKKVEDIMEQRGHAQCHAQFVIWSQQLDVLTVLREFSKIFEGGDQLLHSLLIQQRRILNVLLKHGKSDHTLRWFLKYKDVSDFEARRNLVLTILSEGRKDELYEMLIDRSQLLSESFEYIGQAESIALHGGLSMEFKNEEATGPGVLREWFCLLCKAIFNPENPLFLSCPHDHRRFFPNPASGVDPLHLRYFSFSGRVIALALMYKVQVGIVFDRVFFLQLAGKSVSLEDICDADPVLYRSCKHILEMDSALLDSDVLGLTFAREVEMLGSKKTVELCPGGKDIVVDSRNREEYVSLLIKHCFVTSISEQVTHFADGFADILYQPKYRQFFFNSLDLEDFDQMLGGSTSTINVNEWREHTDYNGYKSKDHQIGWFWKILEDMSEDQLRVLLLFWTSIRHLPVDGFGGLASKLYIYKSSDSQESLPTSHTCFLRLYLPAYRSKTLMNCRLQLIAQEHVGCSFGTS